MTHDQLIIAASAWLRKKQQTIVITDLVSGGYEIPDAIGFATRGSTLVEVKVSRSDFLADRHKPWRRNPERGMGNLRYYLTTPGLIKVNELPEKWGLLELTGPRVRVVKEAAYRPSNRLSEIRLLMSAMRRIAHQASEGLAVKCYTIPNPKAKATLGIMPL